MNAKLNVELVEPSTGTPRSWALFTHGVFGSGANWRSIARKLVERRPTWGAVLVDLRGHGKSESGEPPHTIATAAEDLYVLDRTFAAEGRNIRAAFGHSLGGKVVLALRRRTAHGLGATSRSSDLLQTWVLDATPGARPEALHAPDNDVRRVLELLERQPPRFARREDLIAAVVAEGHAPGLGQWLAMNLEPDGDTFKLRLDLTVARSLLEDHYRQDLWQAVEDPSMPGELHVVAAGRSASVPHADQHRLAEHQQHTGLTILHSLVESGHWLNIDVPDQLVEMFAGALPDPR